MTNEIIMIQPRTSLTGTFVRMLPIGLLYASSRIVKSGIDVHVLDMRINPNSWKRDLTNLINANTKVVGISVMSGLPVLDALRISRHIKNTYPNIYIVWGGPHPTFSPDSILNEMSVDFVIRGYGAEAFHHLVKSLVDKKSVSLDEIPGLSWRDKDGNYWHNDISNSFEFIDYRDIPYHLIGNLTDYVHIDSNEIVFPMYSVMGCPYKCAFCSSPRNYAKFNKKWHTYNVEEVVAHIKMVKEKYGATLIYFIDDDSFVDLKHVEGIIDEICCQGIKIKLGFRGARINEINKMTDDFLGKLAAAGTTTMHIGAESGSDRILSLMNKNITVEQIINANKKMAAHPDIKVFYNFIVGYPTETLEETKMTRDLILMLIKDNPSCCVIPLNKPRPLPATGLYDLAVQHGYVPPKTLEEWGNYDVESSDYNPVWLSNKHNKFIRMMFLSMYFIDDKILKFSVAKSFKFAFLKSLARFYKPIATFRFKTGCYYCLIEDGFYSLFKKVF